MINHILLFVLQCVIFIYRGLVSPVFKPCCRFMPSCSEYAADAIKTYSSYGAWLAVCRVMRCNPLNKNCGYDPLL